MTELLPRDRLQPALLDRLEDDSPEKNKEPVEKRFLGKAQMRAAVLRDLTWLLNATRPPVRDGVSAWHEAERSVLNYGMPSFSGETAASLDIHEVERAVYETLMRFEPRIIEGTLHVEAIRDDNVMDWHNIVSLRIHASVWAQPMPLEFILRTELDLESGLVHISEIGGS